ncbi:Epimerase family protein [Anaerohalosphaera lusitana]|uniref:Epimerase family protein n=1 Tax=Anaerohalosphaera lusitana TaxID=1936003 RepID=A0A1U9NJH5_9BACT|nr:TIGR01777 family oxidoreductase [Anaerohalosphaera lusitana]AQT67730.1 Epimerase family protein [Anaerohalosphaera lusitana]
MTTIRKIVIAGATGFIGQPLCRLLSNSGYEVIALSRYPDKHPELAKDKIRLVHWNGTDTWPTEALLSEDTAVINLAGENIASHKWTKTQKVRILHSRLQASKAIVEAIQDSHQKPAALIQASATGYYGHRPGEEVDEFAGPGNTFLSSVCVEWEDTMLPLADSPTRCAAARFGPVLSEHGGMLEKMLPAFKYWFGNYPAPGSQHVSWIHLEDTVKAVKLILETPQLSGPVNVTAPNPANAKQLARLISTAMRRPLPMPIPGFVLKLAMGEMAKELLLVDQNVLPRKLTEAGFEFKYPDLPAAIQDLIGKA